MSTSKRKSGNLSDSSSNKVFQNKEIIGSHFSRNWDNWEGSVSKSPQNKYDNACATDLNGLSTVFYNVKTTDVIECSYPGYKTKKLKLSDISISQQNNNLSTGNIELKPYPQEEDFDLVIHIGGMGIDDTGKVQIVNERSGEIFTMSQKNDENYRHTNVRIGDTLLFTRRGFRPVNVKFEYQIPERIDIAPIKGKKSDIQYLKF